MTNTYNQSLLDNISREEIRDNIQDARSLVRRLQNFLTMDIIEALDYRLELRYAILRAIELTGLRSNPDSIKMPWVELKAVLEQVNSSHYLGQPVPDAFSPKLQRRLASTMPPRPIVELEFLQAYDMWTAFVADGLEIMQVLNYHDSQTLLVSHPISPVFLITCCILALTQGILTLCYFRRPSIELCVLVSGQEATAHSLHSHAPRELHIQGPNHPGYQEYPAADG